jgi:hypothetical protein
MTPLLLLLLILPALPSAAAGGGCGSLDLRVESIGRHSATVSLIPPQKNTKNIRFEFSTGKQGLSTRPGPRALDRVSLHRRQGGRLVPPHTRGALSLSNRALFCSTLAPLRDTLSGVRDRTARLKLETERLELLKTLQGGSPRLRR